MNLMKGCFWRSCVQRYDYSMTSKSDRQQSAARSEAIDPSEKPGIQERLQNAPSGRPKKPHAECRKSKAFSNTFQRQSFSIEADETLGIRPGSRAWMTKGL